MKTQPTLPANRYGMQVERRPCVNAHRICELTIVAEYLDPNGAWIRYADHVAHLNAALAMRFNPRQPTDLARLKEAYDQAYSDSLAACTAYKAAVRMHGLITVTRIELVAHKSNIAREKADAAHKLYQAAKDEDDEENRNRQGYSPRR